MIDHVNADVRFAGVLTSSPKSLTFMLKELRFLESLITFSHPTSKPKCFSLQKYAVAIHSLTPYEIVTILLGFNVAVVG